MRQYLDTVKPEYDYILLDCTPSLGMLTKEELDNAGKKRRHQIDQL